MKKFRESEDAGSPVIAPILMVGLTVIMVSAIAVSVYGFTLPENAPQAKIVIVEARGDIGHTALNKNFITLKHKGGDALHENATRIIISGKGYAFTSGDDPQISYAKNMRATYKDLAGKNYISGFDNEIVEGTSWDAGETITLYGSDGNDLYLYGWHNNADSRWKLDDGSTVLVTIIHIPTGKTIAVTSFKVTEVEDDD